LAHTKGYIELFVELAKIYNLAANQMDEYMLLTIHSILLYIRSHISV